MAKKIFNKRTLAALLTLVMVFNLTGIGVFAAEETSGPALVQNFQDTYYKQDGSAGSANDWEIHLSKTAAPTAQDNIYSITVKVETKDTFTQIAGTTDGAAVLVLDVSNSMNTKESGCVHEGCEAGKNDAVHCVNYSRRYFWKDSCRHCDQTEAQHEAHHAYTEKTQLDSLKAAVAGFLDAFAEGAQSGEKRLISVVVFGTEAKTIQTWVDVSSANAREDLKALINSLSTGDGAYLGRSYLFNGGTNMEGGLVLGRNLLKQDAVAAIPAANRSLILFSDGAPTASVSNANSTATDSIGYGGNDTGSRTDSVDYDDIASILSSISAAKIAVAYNYNDNLGILDVPPFTRVINSGADSLSVDLQGEASKVITNKTNASTVTDPMGTGVSMVTVTTNYSAATNHWDLSKVIPTVANGITTYIINYQVEIDPEAVAADPNYPAYTVLTPANGETTLNYTYGENATPVSAAFNEPSIRGIRSFTVSYEYVGEVPAGAPEVPADQTYKAGQLVQVAAVPVLANYTFSGWSKQDFVMPAEDVVIIGSWTENAKYDYTLIYDANFETDPRTRADFENVIGTYATYHSLAVDGNHFDRPNYTFIGWNTESDGSGTAYAPAQAITLTAEDNTEILYAQWREYPKYDYTLIYNANFGGNETKADPDNISGIYATSHSIKVDPNGFARPNYTFVGWNTESDGSGTAYTVDQVITLTAQDNTEILYAQWQENPKYDYSVIYNANFGSNETKTDEQNAVGIYENPYGIDVNGNDFVRPNYTFIGWSASPEGEVVYRTGDEIVFTTSGSVTLYAQWEEHPKYDYSVIYDANFDDNETKADEQNISGTYATAYDITVNGNEFDREHHTFLGWSDSREGEVVYQAGDNIHFAEDGQQILYAQWEEHPKYNYTVIYNGNGGTLGEGQLAYGDSENLSDTYETAHRVTVDGNTFLRPNYTFIGWNTAADGFGTAYTAEEAIALTAEENTVTLYAQWQENPKYDYTVIYNANFGENKTKADAENITGIYDVTYSIAADANGFVREGYTFIGWNTAADGSGTAYTAEQAIALTAEANTVTLYAQWQIDRYEYTVNYFVRVNGGEYTLFAGTLPTGAPIGAAADYGTVIDQAYLEALGLPASLTDAEHTYDINAFEGITVTAEGNVVNVYYTCIVEEPPVEIPEETLPKGDISLPEEPPVQEEPPVVEIPEEDVPMTDLPKTGDPVMIFAAMAALSGTGLVVLGRRKKESEEKA